MTDPTAPVRHRAPARLPISAIILGAAFVGLMTLLDRKPEPASSGKNSGVKLGSEEPPASSVGKSDAGRLAEREADRGRKAADAPSQIPSRGWKDIALRVFDKFGRDRILLASAGVTFYAILALFPAIAGLVSIYSLVADPNTINQHVDDLRGILPDGALDIIGEQVKRLAAKGGGTLGLTAIASLLLSLWSANGGVKAVFDALNIAYEEPEKRGFFRLNLQSLAFTAAALLFAALALTSIVVVPAVLQFLGLDEKAWYIALLRWPLLLLAVIFALAALYRYGPSRRKAKWRWVSWGSAVAALLWLAASALFSWYVGHFGSYNQTYGSLGAVIGFMTWMWISTIVVLLGAELNAETERQTLVDTTTGDQKPLGARQAHAADTLAGAA